MITVDKFLCFKLETGGLVIGWLTLVGSALAAVFGLIGILLLCIFNCEDLKNNLGDADTCPTLRGIYIGAFILSVLLGVGFTYLGWLCVQGTKARNHLRIKPLMIVLAIATVCSIFQIFRFSAVDVVSAIINVVVNGYCFVVLYSLYSLLRLEYETGANRQQLQQHGKV